MALTEEQALMDVEIKNVGYHVKFDHQLRDMLSSTKKRLIELKERKDEEIANEDETYAKFDTIWANGEDDYEVEGGVIINNATIGDGKTVAEVKQGYKDSFYNDRLKTWDIQIDKTKSNIKQIETELDFRSQGIVERNPKGTTYFCSYDGNDSTSDASSSATPWRTITSYLENARTKGDVLVMRRVRGGFNPGDNIWINKYCTSRNSKFDSNGTLTGAWSGSINKHGGALAGQSMFQHTAGAIIGNTSGGVTSGTTKLPRQEYIDWVNNGNSNVGDGYQAWYSRTTNPRDKSRLQMMSRRMYSSFYETAGTGDVDTNLRLVSSGTHEDPIMVLADYENVWGDFLSTKDGQNGDDQLEKWSGSAFVSADAQYSVEVGSKILRRVDPTGEPVEVHSYITPGDWVCVGELEATGSPASFNSAVSDDPYEFSYLVRDVNYDKIVLWHPYKGDMAGSQKSLVSMGYAPRIGSQMKKEQASYLGAVRSQDAYSRTMQLSTGNTNHHWVWQGIEFFSSYDNSPQNSGANYWYTSHLIYVASSSSMRWKDCTFWPSSNHNEWGQDGSFDKNFQGFAPDSFYFTGGNHQQNWKKCLFSGGKYGIWDQTTGGNNNFKIEDCVFNGSVMDITPNAMMNEWGANDTANSWYKQWATQTHGAESAQAILNMYGGQNYEIIDTEFVNWYGSHVSTHESTTLSMRGCKFLGMGMDFVDPTTTSNAEAQENLGLRHARACFAPLDNALADGLGDSVNIKYINRSSGNWENNGTGETGTNLGRQWFVYNPGGNAGTNTVASNTAGAWQPQITAFNNASAFINGTDDNKNYMHPDMSDGTDTEGSPKWNNVPFYNGAMALYGVKGLANGTGDYYTFKSDGTGLEAYGTISSIDSSRVFFDWDYAHQTGDGGTWCLTATYSTSHGGVAGDTKKRFPHVYGGVPIPPSTSMQSFGHTQYITGWTNSWTAVEHDSTPWTVNTNNQWGLDNYITDDNDLNSWNRCPNNSTLALYNDAGSAWEYDRFQWDSSNGPGRGIGAMPNLGCIYSYPSSSANPEPGNYHNGYEQSWDMNNVNKITSQDHYELCLNNDYNHYVAWGGGSLLSEHRWKIMSKPLNTGVNGIAKGIVYMQGSHNQDTIGERLANEHWKPFYWRPWLYETIVNTNLQQSGGGNYLIRAYPSANYAQITAPDPLYDSSTRPDQLTSKISNGYGKTHQDKGAMKMFEYPFYLSTNARTYTVSVRRSEGSSEDWVTTVGEEFTYSNYPGASDIYLEFEYWDMDHQSTSMSKMTRKTSRSISGVDFSTNAWQEISITIEPKTEGVGYLRLWYSKSNEVGKLNTFYIDPKVVVY